MSAPPIVYVVACRVFGLLLSCGAVVCAVIAIGERDPFLIGLACFIMLWSREFSEVR